jgi:diadenosine tetraphosphate (Ap4A) HIT family hydrolase
MDRSWAQASWRKPSTLPSASMTASTQVGTAVSAVVPTERLYVLSLGSQQGNTQVHWHVVPLPPGVPYADQQFGLFDLARLGVPDVPAADRDALAAALRSRLGRRGHHSGTPAPT